MTGRSRLVLLAGAVVIPVALAPLLLAPTLAIVFVVAVLLVALASRSVVYPVALAGLPSVFIGLAGGANPLPAGLVTLLVFAWIAGAIALAAIRSDEELPLRMLFAPPILLTLLLAIWLVARLGPSLDPSYGSRKLQLFVVQNIVLLIAGVLIARRPNRIELWIVVALLMAVVSSLVLTKQLVSGQTLGGVEGRVSLTQADNPILLGRDAARGLLLAVFVLLVSRVPWMRLVAFCSVPVIAVSFTASGSRGPVVGLIAGLLVLLAITVRDAASRRRLMVVFGGAVVAIALVPQLVPGGDISRTLSIFTGTGDGTDSNGRSHLWSIAWSQFTSHPLAGIGTGSFAKYGGIFASYPHNILLEAAAELGVVGLVLVGGLIVVAVVQVVRIVRVSEGVDRSQAALVAALLASAVVNAMLSGDITVNSTVWLTAGLVVGLGRRTGVLLPAMPKASMMRGRRRSERSVAPKARGPLNVIETDPGRIVAPRRGERVEGVVDVEVIPARLPRPLESVRLEWTADGEWEEVSRADHRTYDVILGEEPAAVVRSERLARAIASALGARIASSPRRPWNASGSQHLRWDSARVPAGAGSLRAVTRDVDGREVPTHVVELTVLASDPSPEPPVVVADAAPVEPVVDPRADELAGRERELEERARQLAARDVRLAAMQAELLQREGALQRAEDEAKLEREAAVEREARLEREAALRREAEAKRLERERELEREATLRQEAEAKRLELEQQLEREAALRREAETALQREAGAKRLERERREREAALRREAEERRAAQERALEEQRILAADKQPPDVEIVEPREGAVLAGDVRIQVEATDTESGVRSVLVQRSQDREQWTVVIGETWRTEDAADGTWFLRATAGDNAGNLGRTAPVRVEVRNALQANVDVRAGRPTIHSLEAAIASAGLDDERRYELEAMLFYLRDFAQVDGTIPAQFDGLLAEQFGELLDLR